MTDCTNSQTRNWCDDTALPAAEFHRLLLPDTPTNRVELDPECWHMAEPGSAFAVGFAVAGTTCQTLDGGPQSTLLKAVLISVSADYRAETDRLCKALIVEGGTRGQCVG